MTSSVVWGIVGIGILVLLFGAALPSTTTQTATTCYDDPLGPGQECSYSSYEVPNTSKTAMMGIGFFSIVFGGFIALSESSDGDSPKSNSSSSNNEKTLSEKIEERKKE